MKVKETRKKARVSFRLYVNSMSIAGVKKFETFSLTVTVPCNTTAEIWLPAGTVHRRDSGSWPFTCADTDGKLQREQRISSALFR